MSGESSVQTAAQLAAATALLIQISPYSFDPGNEFSGTLTAALAANSDYFAELPGNAGNTLSQVVDGGGPGLAEQEGAVHEEIDRALHSDENEGFVMQKACAAVETDLLEHPASAEYLQSVADRMVRQVDEGFEDDECVSDLSREAFFMGAFGLLLVIPQSNVDADLFRKWQKRYHDVRKSMEPIEEEDEIEIEFEEAYNECLELAFKCGIERYSAG